jgi:hypothetical protein
LLELPDNLRSTSLQHHLCARFPLRALRGCSISFLVRSTAHRLAMTAGLSPQFPGVLVGPPPPPVRKCHQMSSKEHIQLGWVVRWVLITPPGHPAAGRCGRVVPVLPLLLCRFYLPCASSAFGWGSTPPLPLRASSRGVLPGAPNALSV